MLLLEAGTIPSLPLRASENTLSSHKANETHTAPARGRREFMSFRSKLPPPTRTQGDHPPSRIGSGQEKQRTQEAPQTSCDCDEKLVCTSDAGFAVSSGASGSGICGAAASLVAVVSTSNSSVGTPLLSAVATLTGLPGVQTKNYRVQPSQLINFPFDRLKQT